MPPKKRSFFCNKIKLYFLKAANPKAPQTRACQGAQIPQPGKQGIKNLKKKARNWADAELWKISESKMIDPIELQGSEVILHPVKLFWEPHSEVIGERYVKTVRMLRVGKPAAKMRHGDVKRSSRF